MNKIGCCVDAVNSENKLLDRKYINTLAEYGCDYLELPLTQLMKLSEDEFLQLTEELATAKINCEVCNIFFPKEVRLTGEEVSLTVVENHIRTALEKAKKIGAKIVVFGSGGAKNIPEGFPYDKAHNQLVEALKIIDKYAVLNDILIAIEPLNHKESNIILNLTEATKLMKSSEYKNIKLLVDYYHYSLENDNEEAVLTAMPDLVHVHFAEPEGRGFPLASNPEYVAFYELLKNNNYQGRISFEANSKKLDEDLPKAIATLMGIADEK